MFPDKWHFFLPKVPAGTEPVSENIWTHCYSHLQWSEMLFLGASDQFQSFLDRHHPTKSCHLWWWHVIHSNLFFRTSCNPVVMIFQKPSFPVQTHCPWKIRFSFYDSVGTEYAEDSVYRHRSRSDPGCRSHFWSSEYIQTVLPWIPVTPCGSP